MTFAVERTIDGVRFLKDEDYIEAESLDEADLKLMMGILSGRFDLTCKIIGLIIGEIEIPHYSAYLSLILKIPHETLLISHILISHFVQD